MTEQRLWHESVSASPRQAAQARLVEVAFGRRVTVPPWAAKSRQPVQRLVVNTGDTPLLNEVRKKRGWIVAKDIDIALQDGGLSQEIVEPDQLAQMGQIGSSENVYLEGHGSAGKLGHQDPKTVAKWLRPHLPTGYAGTIYSLSCSAGVPKATIRSGVEALARALGVPGIQLEGAAGVALNHPALPGSHRVIKEDQYKRVDSAIDAAIDRHHVDRLWNWYIDNVWTGSLSSAAAVATGFSEAFYIDITQQLDGMGGVLLPSDRDTTVVRT